MDFIGQRPIIEGFKDNIRQKSLGHAYALTGPAGIGKRTLAHYIAKMILCNGEGDIPCGNCRSCKSFEAGGNPGYIVIKNETQKILIGQIRDLIENISIRPAFGYKVYIIQEADRMTPEAQNALLKTLEEPPEYAVIILTTAFYESLLVTVRSRLVQMKLKPYSFEEMKGILQSNGLDIKGKEHIFNLSSGIPGKAMQLLNDKNFEETRDVVMSALFNRDGFSRLNLNQYLSNKKEVFKECLDILESVYRDALIVCFGVSDGLINYDKKDNIVEYAINLNPNEITQKIHNIQKVRDALKHNMNYQLAVDMITLEVDNNFLQEEI